MSEVLDREDFLKIAQQFGDKATIKKFYLTQIILLG